MADRHNKRPDLKPAAATAAGGSRQGPLDVSQETIATYDQIAAAYYEEWRDRSAIQHHLTRFVDMIRVYGLGDRPVIDVGCGPGFDASFFRGSGLHAVGLDLSPAMMKAGRPVFGGEYVQADMRYLPLAPVAGGLWVGASLLHLPRAEVPAILSGFAAVLAPGGLLYLSLKAGHGEEWTSESHGRPLPRYFVYWQPDELDAALRAAGFQIVEARSAQPASQPAGWSVSLAKRRPVGCSIST